MNCRSTSTFPINGEAITLAAEAIADREAIYRYIDTLPIEGKLKQEIKGILILDYQLGGR